MDITSDNINDIKGRAIKPWESCGLNAEDCVQISADNLINITSKLDTFIPDNNLTVWGGGSLYHKGQSPPVVSVLRLINPIYERAG